MRATYSMCMCAFFCNALLNLMDNLIAWVSAAASTNARIGSSTWSIERSEHMLLLYIFPCVLGIEICCRGALK